MPWNVLYQSVTGSDTENFRKAVELVNTKPQVLNKRCAGARIVYLQTLECSFPCEPDVSAQIQKSIIAEVISSKRFCSWKSLSETNNVNHIASFITNSLGLPKSISKRESPGEEGLHSYCNIILQMVIPKSNNDCKLMNCVLFTDSKLLCIPLLSCDNEQVLASTDPIYQFSLEITPTVNRLFMEFQCDEVSKPSMLEIMFKRFLHFCDTSLKTITNQSLRLVNIENYTALYNTLKDKHAEYLITNWSEKTDPKKFVYEDIAIAAYLLMLFQHENVDSGLDEKQTFIDIGCGNGLLVYLLNKEGHKGTGIDIRRRNIWDFFKGIDLQEKALTPSDDVLFPNYDWIIGNHSDEMTPWIPVISARSKFSSRFFVLPCCPHDFNGKFRERKHDQSVYQAYLDYVEEIVKICGFNPERDMLKIPSTKRTCIVGRVRTYKETEEDMIDAERTSFIKYRCQKLIDANGSLYNPVIDDWGTFTPRLKEEKVRNCTQIDRDLRTQIVRTIFNLLLDLPDFVVMNGKRWNQGGAIPLGELADNLGKETLQKLKNECGGLQTLLKNPHHIFLIIKGVVRLRPSQGRNNSDHNHNGENNEDYRKTCLCWFHENHPDGCWQTAAQCSYAHGESDLRSPKSKRHRSS